MREKKECKHTISLRNYEDVCNPTGTMYGLFCDKCSCCLIAMSKRMYTEPQTYKKVLLYLKENNLADRITN